jgi:aromatase
MSGHTDNEIVIDAPVDVVWKEANDLKQWPVLFAEEYDRVDVLDEADGRVTFRITTKPQENGRQYSWVSERVPDAERHQVIARRIETGPFLYMHIVHAFTEAEAEAEAEAAANNQATRVRWVQDFEMRPGAPFTDEQMTARINNGSKQNLMRHKEVIEKHWQDIQRREKGIG